MLHPLQINLGIGYIAITSFMNSFSWSTYNDYIPELWQRPSRSKALEASVEAVGLANLSLIRVECGLLEEAREKHLMAVQAVQHALNVPIASQRADTLACIMLMALFAGMTMTPAAAQATWTKHIKGALAVLDLQKPGEEADQKVISILTSHVTSSDLINSQQSSMPTSKRTLKIKSEPRIPNAFQAKSEYALDKLATVKSMQITILNAAPIFADLDDIEEALDELLHILLKIHPFQIVATFSEHEPSQHLYVNHKSARIWNIIRTTKLTSAHLRSEKAIQYQMATKLTGEVAMPVHGEQQLRRSKASGQALIHDICASVPRSLRDLNVEERQQLQGWAYVLIWPLSFVKSSSLISAQMKGFAKTILQNIWEVTGFGKVDFRENKVNDEVDPAAWTHIFMMS